MHRHLNHSHLLNPLIPIILYNHISLLPLVDIYLCAHITIHSYYIHVNLHTLNLIYMCSMYQCYLIHFILILYTIIYSIYFLPFFWEILNFLSNKNYLYFISIYINITYLSSLYVYIYTPHFYNKLHLTYIYIYK